MSRITSSLSKISLAAAGLLLLLLAPLAQAQSQSSLPSRIEMAREASGTTDPPKTTHPLPGGQLRLTQSEFLAAIPGQKVEVNLELAKPAADARLLVTLPKQWRETPESGLPFAKAPRAGKNAAGRARFQSGGRRVELAIAGGKSGDVASFSVENVGIVPGSYDLEYAWIVDGKQRAAGTARVAFYSPERETPEQEAPANPWSKLAIPGIAANGSNNADENSEVFIATTPGNPDRIVIGANDNSPNLSNGDNERHVWITNNGGKRWRKLEMPYYTDAFGNDNTEYQSMCCDPAWAADDQGNFWYSLITDEADPEAGVDGPSRIVVNRIGAKTEKFQDYTVGLQARTSGQQDKQMMTIDNSPTSPTYGRVMIVWNEPQPTGGKLNVISHCDTFVKVGTAKVRRPERCDVPENWTRPAPVGDGGINEFAEIYVDVAVGKTGKVYVTWLDFSSRNAILGSVCDPGTAPATSPTPDRCSAPTGVNWNGGSDYPSNNFKTIALLDKTGNKPIPFFCKIMSAPAGRVGATPSVEVDRSGLSYNDRVYVAWSDLYPGSGTTRCAVDPMTGRPTPAEPTHLRWETYVGSLNAGRLPGGPTLKSGQAGRTVLRNAKDSEEYFPWLAVDQITGQAWVNFYSTTGDPDRYQTNHYVRATTLNLMGKLTKVSQFPSNYGGTASTGNDYGDYQGMDATGGRAFPVWTDNSAGDGEATTYISQPARPKPGGALTQLTGAAACVSQSTGDCTTLGRGIGNPQDVAVSPDNKHVYVAGQSDYPSQYGALSVYTKSATGGLTQLTGTAGCITQLGEGGCRDYKAIEEVSSVIVSPDGKHVYALSPSYPVGLTSFTRNATTGALTPLAGTSGCMTEDGTDYNEGHEYPYPVECAAGRKIDNALKLEMSPDGKFVYALDGSTYDGALAVFSRNTTTGKLTQLAGTAGCMSSDGEDGDSNEATSCAVVPILGENGLHDLAFSADGKSVYAAANRDVVIFSRNTTSGALTNLTTGGCLNENGGEGCLDMDGVESPDTIIVSPDGKHVYVAGSYSNLAVLQRNATSYRLTQPEGQQKCLTYEGTSYYPYCDHTPAMNYANEFAMPKDGGTLHIVADENLVQLDRDPVSGALTDLAKPYSCNSEEGTIPWNYRSTDGDCVNVKGLDDTNKSEYLTGIALSPDDKFVYATSSYGESVVNFARTPTVAPPVCETNRQTVGINFGKKIRLICKDDLGNPMTLSIVTPPAKGSVGTIDQATQTVTYTPPAGEIGDTSFTYRATDATGNSATATIYITIAN